MASPESAGANPRPMPEPPETRVDPVAPPAQGGPGSTPSSGDPPPEGRQRRGMGPAVPPPIADVAPAAGRRARDSFFRRAVVTGDLLAGTGAFLLAAGVAGSGQLRAQALLALPLLVVFAKFAGLYDRDDLLIDKATSVDEVPQVFHVATVTALVTAVAGEVAWEQSSAVAIVVLWVGLVILMVAFRGLARAFALRHTTAERCLVIGDADAAALLSAKLEMSRSINSHVVGYVPLADRIRADDPTPLGTLADLADVVAGHDVHRVIIAGRGTDSELPLDVIRHVKALGVMVSILPRIFEVVGSSVEFDDLEGLTVLGVRRFGLTRWARALKRTLDVAGAAAGLVAASPLLTVIAIAVKRDSPGPVFFRQPRVGRDGEVFQIVKFRTMAADADARKADLADRNETEGLFKISNDPRVTRVGRFLRRTSLDELPQLLNVLLGKMSLVGPRPLVLEEDKQIQGWHRRRLHLKPGMTGPWQILGSGRIPLYEMVKIDYLYVANWSMWNDVKVLIRTIPYVLARRGL